MSTNRPELPFPEMPAQWGKGRAVEYAEIAADYAKSPEEEVYVTYSAIGRLLQDTPRCPDHVKKLVWDRLRTWNLAQMEETGFDAEGGVVCPCCGEYRQGGIRAEIAVVVHALPLTRHGNLVRVAPPSCRHDEFELQCLSCDWHWTDGEPVVAFGMAIPTMPEPLPGEAVRGHAIARQGDEDEDDELRFVMNLRGSKDHGPN